jgi:hypothetical protein
MNPLTKGIPMGHAGMFIVSILALAGSPCVAQQGDAATQPAEHWEGLHGYISFEATMTGEASAFNAGIGFYTAVWALTDEPLEGFQIGHPSTWILPDNSDNKDRPLAPEGTVARNWPERGPTWDSVFQTIEGGVGLWAGNHFRYGLPKFSMNGTPQCYDFEIGSPGWSFFQSSQALADDRLGIAQLSNRLLIPPDGLPFAGKPDGQFLGYTWLALPFTDPVPGDPPVGDQGWTCFLNAANFKGPIAYYIPETWTKAGKNFNYPFIYGRGLDARPGTIGGGGAIEINTVPRFDSTDAAGVTYSKIPALRFPVDAQGRTLLVQDVTYYAKAALSDAFKAWRDGGPPCTGAFDAKGAWKPALTTSNPTIYQQAGKTIAGVDSLCAAKVFEGNVWGLEWPRNDTATRGVFPQYFKDIGDTRVVVPAKDVPAETALLTQKFRTAERREPYTSPRTPAWTNPGPKTEPLTARLVDGSIVTYAWYRFVDQPSFRQYDWSDEKKAALQSLVEKIHAAWTIDRDYMAPPGVGELVELDPGLIVSPPKGMEIGYVPIVIGQAAD